MPVLEPHLLLLLTHIRTPPHTHPHSHPHPHTHKHERTSYDGFVFILPTLAAFLGLGQEHYQVSEEDGSLQVCVMFFNHTERNVTASVYGLPGSASGKNVIVRISLYIDNIPPPPPTIPQSPHITALNKIIVHNYLFYTITKAVSRIMNYSREH